LAVVQQLQLIPRFLLHARSTGRAARYRSA